ncbi:MAG: MBL fold metallo-hydrolase [Candidatus Hydrothermarchaeota archaeon]|nr:MAG: MBL fold metallo-hydrolase [Candidatus Hydrothermarchaeota archaeon]
MQVNNVEVSWLGHASFKIKSKLVVYIDPYAGEYDEKADIVLITHDHFDHLDKSKIELVKKDETITIAPEKGAEKLSGYVRTVLPGDKMEVKGVEIEATHAYNINKPYHPKNFGVGYILTINGIRIYHAGDTDFIPEMKELREKVDVALLPIGGTYTMNVREAAEAAITIKPKIAFPMHYNSLPELKANPKEFERLIKEKDPSIEVRFE